MLDSLSLPRAGRSRRQAEGRGVWYSRACSRSIRNGRQAVAELLWVLESVSTGFDGAEAAGGTIKGKYFNAIVKEMQAKTLSTHQRQILAAMVALHGYLSSPTGGGIRHGQDLQKGTPLTANDALVFCNIIRSYITYMLGEHERHKRN